MVNTVRLDPASPLSDDFRSAVTERIVSFLDAQSDLLASVGAELEPVRAMATALLGGGKRLRPAFCLWSAVAAGGLDLSNQDAVLTAAASLELLHGSALVHDDVMDSSDLRRGRPAAHRQFEGLHTDHSWGGDPVAFGQAGAILLGDLLLMWSAEMLQQAQLSAAAMDRVLPLVQAMRTEVTCGQYLDVVAQASPWPDSPTAIDALAQASRVTEFKSARYTVQRPCQLGAAAVTDDKILQRMLADYGSPLGRAFQFRDDLLGVFGDPQVTGKPTGDDLREGKRTVLIAHAYAGSTDAGRRLLRDRLGSSDLDVDGIAALQEVINDSGATVAVENMIEDAHREATSALSSQSSALISEDGRTALLRLAAAAVNREL